MSRFLLGGLFICLHKEQDEVSKITKGGRSGGAAYLLCRRLQAARLANFDLLWSWKLEVLASPSSLRSLSQNFSEAAEAPPRRCPWAKIARYRRSLARATGPFPPTTAPRFWRQFLSQASTCPWAHIGRFKRYSLARGHLLFSPTEPVCFVECKRHMFHVRHNFAQRFNFKYNERHVHCKLE